MSIMFTGERRWAPIKLLYDLTNVIWFIATIYLTFSFTHLLPGKGGLDRVGASAKIKRISVLAGASSCVLFYVRSGYSLNCNDVSWCACR